MSGPKRLSVRNGLRIATSNHRTLDAFEEHRIKEWHWSGWGVPNWRAIRGTERCIVFGQYECLDCGQRHKLPDKNCALICIFIPEKEAKKRAIGYIELKIARAKGQHEGIETRMLSDLAYEIGDWPRRYSWGPAVHEAYLKHPKLNEHLTKDTSPLPDHGHNQPLPEGAGEMIFNHLPLVRKNARRRASVIWDEKTVGKTHGRIRPRQGNGVGQNEEWKSILNALNEWSGPCDRRYL